MTIRDLQFYCPYCQQWITDVVHDQHHHHDPDLVDRKKDFRVKAGDGVVYDDEVEYSDSRTAGSAK